MDRGLLTFDLVTRLSQVLKSASKSDEKSSDRIVNSLLESCRSLHGDCHSLSTLERSTIILLLNLATTHEKVRLKTMPPLMRMLFSINANSLVWSENFETDFAETFLLQLLKCDASSGLMGIRSVSGLLGQLELLINRAAFSEEPFRQMLIIRGMFRVISLAPQFLWINYIRSIVDFSQKTMR